jgi:hypothetical protein
MLGSPNFTITTSQIDLRIILQGMYGGLKLPHLERELRAYQALEAVSGSYMQV